MTIITQIMCAIGNQIQATGQQEYVTPGTYTFTVPANVTSISSVLVGGGGGGRTAVTNGGTTGYYTSGGGGGLRYINNFPVTPGQSYTVVVASAGVGGSITGVNGVKMATAGGNSYIRRNSDNAIIVQANGGQLGATSNVQPVIGGAGGDGTTFSPGPVSMIGGGNGGNGGWSLNGPGGGGGAGGYSGNGGNGGWPTSTYNVSAKVGLNGQGGGGGGGEASALTPGSGGGVGILGQGSNGAGGAGYAAATGGSGGAPGTAANVGGDGTECIGGNYGGGGGASTANQTPPTNNRCNGGSGAVRIIWGPDRSFPSTRTGNL